MKSKRNLFFRKPFKYSYFNVTIILIIINCIVYALDSVFPWYIKYYGALNVISVEHYHMYWQFITYMFVHGNFSHLLFNMLGLLIFGITIEKTVGSKEFLLYYLLCGVLSGVFSFFVYKCSGFEYYFVMLIGASGAIYSLLFAYAVLYPRSTLYIWGVLPIPAPILVLIYTIIEVVSQFIGGDGIAHLTHLFGFVAAFFYFIIRMGINPLKVWKRNY